MPVLQTKNFGNISFEPDSELEFPYGLPGFESCRKFVAVRFVESDPLVYLQSLEDTGLCFITMPILAADAGYKLQVSDEDLGRLGLRSRQALILGEDVLCLAVLSLSESGPTANLLAPIVVNLRNRKAVQTIAAESDYPHQFALMPEETAVCS